MAHTARHQPNSMRQQTRQEYLRLGHAQGHWLELLHIGVTITGVYQRSWSSTYLRRPVRGED